MIIVLTIIWIGSEY